MNFRRIEFHRFDFGSRPYDLSFEDHVENRRNNWVSGALTFLLFLAVSKAPAPVSNNKISAAPVVSFTLQFTILKLALLPEP